MRTATKPLRRNKQALTASIPAPVGGWNARDSLSDMDTKDAIRLENFWPLPDSVMVRKGYSEFATGLGAQVQSLLPYNNGTTSKLFAAASTKIYNVSAGGAVGAAVVSSLSNAWWQSVNVSTSGGNFMLAVNSADKLRGYDGTNWWADGDGTHDITGFDTSTASHINLFKTRVWLIQENSLKVWYLGTNAIAGAATAIDFQAIARKGGYLVAMQNWTIDAGAGVDDHAVFVTSEGEVIVYKGTDPSSANTWALVGVWELGSPIGARCMMKLAGDVLLMTQDGLVPLSGALQSSRVNPRVAITDKIQAAVSEAATSYGSTQGWDLAYYAKANMLLMNVPVAVGSQEQYAMNTITKSWCKFSGWDANCWTVFNDDIYFGANGVVCKAWDTFADNSTNIDAVAQQAYNYYESRGALKQWTMCRPIFQSNGSPAINASLNIDFSDSVMSAPLSVPAVSFSAWDSGKWDTATWGGGLSLVKNWQGINGLGYAASLTLQIATKTIETKWISTDFVMERGGIL